MANHVDEVTSQSLNRQGSCALNDDLGRRVLIHARIKSSHRGIERRLRDSRAHAISELVQSRLGEMTNHTSSRALNYHTSVLRGNDD